MYRLKMNCRFCGREMLVRSTERNRLYCGRSCASRSRTLPKEYAFDQPVEWVKVSEEPSDCPYAEGLNCTERKCGTCGWNPEVAQKRLEQILARLELTLTRLEEVSDHGSQ